MKHKLNVFVNQFKAGELWLDPQRRFCFQYNESWIDSKDSCRLSVSLPLRKDPFLNDDSYSYFTNLLPEGKILNVLSRKLRIPVSNQFELLKAIGGDCAGAVSLFEEGALPPEPSAYSYKDFADDHLMQMIKKLPENPFLADKEGIRLSLAGAQDTGIKYKVVKETIVDMADKIVGGAKKTTEEFCDRYGKSPVLDEINDVINNSSREKLSVFS